MFLHLSVSHSVHGGGVPGQVHPQQVHPLGRYTPWAGTPPGPGTPPEQCMLGDTGNKQAVRILLECILVGICFSFILNALMVYSHWPELRQGLEPRINGLYETFYKLSHYN